MIHFNALFLKYWNFKWNSYAVKLAPKEVWPYVSMSNVSLQVFSFFNPFRQITVLKVAVFLDSNYNDFHCYHRAVRLVYRFITFFLFNLLFCSDLSVTSDTFFLRMTLFINKEAVRAVSWSNSFFFSTIKEMCQFSFFPPRTFGACPPLSPLASLVSTASL